MKSNLLLVLLVVLISSEFSPLAYGNPDLKDRTKLNDHLSSHLKYQNRATTVEGYGNVMFVTESTNQIVYFETTLLVPPTQASVGTVFVWPGLQPGGDNYQPIGTGVLQPVLTWGSSCVQSPQPTPYSSWWISGAYVNLGNLPGYSGCLGGDSLNVSPADRLKIQFFLNGTVWTQIITNTMAQQQVTYSIDLQGQSQNLVLFWIELYNSASMVNRVMFSNSKWKFASPTTTGCTLAKRGIKDSMQVPTLSADKLTCTVASINLYAQ